MESFAVMWDRFFSDLSTFLGSLERADHPNYNYSEYAVQRLELWIISLCQLITHIEADTNTETVRQIVSNINKRPPLTAPSLEQKSILVLTETSQTYGTVVNP